RYHILFFSSRRRHTRFSRDWSSDVCSSDLVERVALGALVLPVVFEPGEVKGPQVGGGFIPQELGIRKKRQLVVDVAHPADRQVEIGRASCRERRPITDPGVN